MRGQSMRIEVQNRIHVGDTLEALTPGGVYAFRVTGITREDTGESADFVSIAGMRVLLPVDFTAEEGDYLMGPNRNHRMDTGEKADGRD